MESKSVVKKLQTLLMCEWSQLGGLLDERDSVEVVSPKNLFLDSKDGINPLLSVIIITLCIRNINIGTVTSNKFYSCRLVMSKIIKLSIW